ncbi:hypothetical protein [uncultured Nostoc sp.]|uniref:hypothetical protein n=1 Tax=uncultured Nostoc sp. TaxID=340711 RepID=UPI0035CBF9F2
MKFSFPTISLRETKILVSPICGMILLVWQDAQDAHPTTISATPKYLSKTLHKLN